MSWKTNRDHHRTDRELRIENLENPQRLRDLKLVQLRSEGGWLTLGWRYVGAGSGVRGVVASPTDTPAIVTATDAAPGSPE